jgi:Leucine-rich repeat (LRR) protein
MPGLRADSYHATATRTQGTLLNFLGGIVLVSAFYFCRLSQAQSRNQLTGTLPRGAIDIRSLPGDVRSRKTELGGRWSDLTSLKRLFLNDNQFSGKIPPELLLGLSGTLVQMDVGNNRLEGSIPSEIGKMMKLEQIDAQGNRITGTLPAEMNRMFPDIRLNLTNNL